MLQEKDAKGMLWRGDTPSCHPLSHPLIFFCSIFSIFYLPSNRVPFSKWPWLTLSWIGNTLSIAYSVTWWKWDTEFCFYSVPHRSFTSMGTFSDRPKLLQCNSIKLIIPLQKWARDLKRYFTKDIQLANRYMTKCPVSQIIREIKTTMRYYVTIY